MTVRRPRVSIILLTWNSADVVGAAVAGIQAQTYPDIEFVVVDNGSTDGSVAAVRRTGIDPIQLGTNTGYAAGMNAGYARSSGDFVIPLNADAILHPDFVARAVECFDRAPEVHILGALVLRIEPGQGWDRGPWLLDGGRVGLRPWLSVYLSGPIDTEAPSFKPNGACPVIRRATIERVALEFGVGPFDPVFDTFGEDVDFAFKAWRLGLSTLYQPQLLALHVRSHSSARRLQDRRGRLRTTAVAARWRNAFRHLPAPMLARAVPMLAATDLGLCVAQTVKADFVVWRDVASAWHRIWTESDELRSFRGKFTPMPSTRLRERMNAGDRIADLVVTSLPVQC